MAAGGGPATEPLEHDPEKACPGLDPGWVPVFGKGLPPRKRGSCSNNNLKRDDESKRSHHALEREKSLSHPDCATSTKRALPEGGPGRSGVATVPRDRHRPKARLFRCGLIE